jgi:hypothetical protein
MDMLHKSRPWIAAAALLLGAGAARADVIGFDDLSPGFGAALPDGYAGFAWDNIHVLNSSLFPNSGYDGAAVSQTNVAYNAWGSAAAVEDGAFTFNGAYFTAAWRDGLNVQVQGYSGGTLLYDWTIVVDHDGPTWFAFNYVGIDRLTFNSFGGTEVEGLSGSGAQFAMDDFTYNVPHAPLPPAALLGLGLIGGIGAVRRLRRRARH